MKAKVVKNPKHMMFHLKDHKVQVKIEYRNKIPVLSIKVLTGGMIILPDGYSQCGIVASGSVADGSIR